MKYIKQLYLYITHLCGRLAGSYYFEDFVRVYDGRAVYNRLGFRRNASPQDRNNYLNHVKFYNFVAQFVQGKVAADIGCGAGYGSKILKNKGASLVYGVDISRQAISYARTHYHEYGEFSMQGVTDLSKFQDNQFDITVLNEVLEHIKEYHKEAIAITELKRVTKHGGLIIIGTPNTELLGEHGFRYDEMNTLLKGHFSEYMLFENALLPFGGNERENWKHRLQDGNHATIISELINLDEVVCPKGVALEIKHGQEPSLMQLGTYQIQTSLLHNTHSWVVVAVNP